jgi:hypothetical protein
MGRPVSVNLWLRDETNVLYIQVENFIDGVCSVKKKPHNFAHILDSRIYKAVALLRTFVSILKQRVAGIFGSLRRCK